MIINQLNTRIERHPSGTGSFGLVATLCFVGACLAGCATPASRSSGAGNVMAGAHASAMPAQEVLRLFDLKGFTADRSGDGLQGTMGAIKDKGDERLLKTAFKASRFQFGFSVKSKWYHGALVRFGDYFVYYSRGHWLNSATMVATPDGERRFKDKKVEEPDQFSRVEVRYADGALTFFYNGDVEDVVDIPQKYRSGSILVGFCGYNAAFAIRDVVLIKQ